MAEKKEKKEANIYLKRLGERLLELKKDSGLVYRKIAARCNVDYADIKKYENGEIDIRFTTIAELAKGYGTHPKKILEFDWGNEYPPDEEQQLKDRITFLEQKLSELHNQIDQDNALSDSTIKELQKQLTEKDKEIKRLISKR